MEKIDPQNKTNTGMKPKTMAIGVLVISFGMILLLRNLDMLNYTLQNIIFSWQMLLIAIGFVNLFNPKNKGVGIILMSIGGFFLLSDMYDWPLTFRRIFWPSLIMLLGVILVFGSGKIFRRRNSSGSIDDGESFEEVSIFGGDEKNIVSTNLKEGRIVSIFGGSNIDLKQSTLDPNGAEIEVVAIFGGSKLIVPQDWNVRLEIFNIFGGYGDKRPQAQIDTTKTLVVKGVAIFGGGEIKSF